MKDTFGSFITEFEAISYLEQYNLPYPSHGLAKNEEEAARIADRLGYPVVLKVVSHDVIHKSEVGGVALGLNQAEEVKQAYENMFIHMQTILSRDQIEGALICRQAEEGTEVIVGGIQDKVFGPTLMFGLGGVFTEILDDVAFRVAPLERIDAEEMISEVKGFPLLTGARGRVNCDIEQLIQLILSVSRMITERTEIKEVDLNPVRLYERGLQVLDVRMMLSESKNRTTFG